MNDALKMQISAFVDGELSSGEAELLLRRLSQDAAMRQQVADYLAIGRVLRRDRDVPGMEHLRSRIAGAISEAAEDVVEEVEEKAEIGQRLMTPASGVAVAATVAAVALVGLSQLNTPESPGLAEAVAIDRAPAYTEPTAQQVLANEPDERLRNLLRLHGDRSPGAESGDILYRLTTLEVSQLVEIPPDEHLTPTPAEAGADENSEQDTQN